MKTFHAFPLNPIDALANHVIIAGADGIAVASALKTINGQSLLGGGDMAISVDLTGYATTQYVDDEVNANGASLQAFASNASNLASGTVADARLSANVARRDQANTFAATQTVGGSVAVNLDLKNASNVTYAQFNGTARSFYAGNDAFAVLTADGTTRLYNNGALCWNSGAIASSGTIDASIRRNATGPTLETRAAGGLRVCNADGSALAALTCGVFTTDFGSGVDIQTQAANWRIGHRVGGTFRTGFDYYHLNVHSSYLVRWSNSSSSLTTVDTTLSRASAGVLQVGNAPGSNALGSLLLANLTASGTVQGTLLPTQFTVATLPSAAANTGRTVQVTDSSVDFPGNIGNTVAGGGAFNVDVKSNGTNWRITG